MESRNFFWAVMLLGTLSVAGINWYFSWKNAQRVAVSSADMSPDIIMQKISQLNFTDAGERDFQLNAGAAAHYSGNGATEFQSPQLIFFQNNAENWDARANNGATPNNGQDFHFSGDVVIRKLRKDDMPVEMRTQSMTISSRDDTAETADSVTIIQGSQRTESTGLRVDMNSGKLQLKSRVHSQYLPPAS